MSDQTTIVEVDTSFGQLTVEHVIETTLDYYDAVQVEAHYEVRIDDDLKHQSKDPEDIMRALGHYIAGLSND